MFTTTALLESNVSPPVSFEDQVEMYNYKNPASFEVGEYIVVTVGIAFALNEEIGTNIVSYSNDSGSLSTTLTGLPLSFPYDMTRVGWIYIYDGSFYYQVKVKQHRYTNGSIYFQNYYTASVLEILEKKSGIIVNYVFTNTLTFSKGGSVFASVYDVVVNETDQSNIEIDFAGVDFNASYSPTTADITALNGGTLYLELTIKESSSAGTIIYNEVVSTTTQTNLAVNIIIASEDFSGDVLYAEVKIYDAQGGGGSGGGEDPINPQ